MEDNVTSTIGLSQEVQFSGIGDFVLDSYVYYLLKAVAITGILGNTTIFIILLKHRKPAGGYMECLLLNQSIADLLTATMLLIATHVHVPDDYPYMSWSTEFICRVFRTQMLLTIFFTTSVYNLVIITFTQYMIIVHPIFYHNHMKHMKGYIYVCSAWIFSISLNMLLTIPLSGVAISYPNKNADYTGSYTQRQNGMLTNSTIKYFCTEFDYHLDESGRRMSGLVTGIAYFILPTLIIMYSFWHILFRLQNQRYQVGPHGHASIFRSVKMSVLKTIFLFFSVFIICWSLNSFINILHSFNAFSEFFYKSSLYSASVVIFYCCCAINPLLYAVRYKKFREAVHVTISNCCSQLKRHKLVFSIAVIHLEH